MSEWRGLHNPELHTPWTQTCGAGLHLWVEENIYIRPDNGRAHCKPCRLERSAEYRKRSK